MTQRPLLRIRLQAFFALAVLLAASVLTHEIPARHALHLLQLKQEASAPAVGEVKASLGTAPSPVAASEETVLSIALTGAQGRPLRDIEITHDRIMHVVIASSDFTVFSHIHPEDFGEITEETRESGVYRVRFRFPKAGRYIIGADFGVGNTLYSRRFTLDAEGAPRMAPFKKDLARAKTFGELTATLSTSPLKITAGEETVLTFHISDKHGPITDLEPYLAAVMHASIISSDLEDFIHEHGELPGLHSPGHMHHAEGHGRLHGAVPPKFGPDIRVRTILPSKGVYQIFGEIRRRGKVTPLSFMVEAD